ncbi:MAG: hypothetical protein LBG96_11695 [Tannerella sp.]|jgi:hypothetical protein|nr:hypothetical protein [Tannerella sp.]
MWETLEIYPYHYISLLGKIQPMVADCLKEFFDIFKKNVHYTKNRLYEAVKKAVFEDNDKKGQITAEEIMLKTLINTIILK